MCQPKPRPGESVKAAGGGALALVVVALAVWGVLEVAGAVAVVGAALLTLLLIAAAVVVVHTLLAARWSERRQQARRRASRPAPVPAIRAAELDEVTVHAEVVEEPRRAITAEQRAAAEAWAERWLYGESR